MVVPLAELASTWTRGTYAVEVAWDPSGLAGARGQAAAVEASQTSLNISEFTIARVLATVKLDRGAMVRLPDGVQVKFTGSFAQGRRAGVHITVDRSWAGDTGGQGGRGGIFVQSAHRAYAGVLGAGYAGFELVDYAYDDWMRVKYYGRVKRR